MNALPLLLALLTNGAAGGPPPTRAALQRVLAAVERSAVEVEGPRGRGPGITVGAGGEVLTTVDHVGPLGAVVWHRGERREARVVLADPDTRLALLKVEDSADLAAVPVQVLEAVVPGTWLLSVTSWRAQRYPVKLQSRSTSAPARHFSLSRALPPASPLFDSQGRLVALVVRRAGRGRALALPLSELTRQLPRAEAQ
ncbi:MAG: serine protease [Myxococcaceae bacterium]|nr:serine protease [Myxococcaceae bacterium]MCI0668896.1 serine protease [Myxococcaceae bacterium]